MLNAYIKNILEIRKENKLNNKYKLNICLISLSIKIASIFIGVSTPCKIILLNLKMSIWKVP